MRVTSSMMVRSTLRDLGQSLARLQTTQTRLSSGRDFAKASDNPTAAANAMTLRQQLGRLDHRARSLNDAQGWIDTADVVLMSAGDRLIAAKEITVRASNSAASDPNARVAFAAEIRAIRADLLTMANTTYGNRPLFAGTTGATAYDASGTYLGNSAAVVRDVAAQTELVVNIPGPDVFGAGGGPVGNVFEVLDRLAAAIEAGDGTAVAAEHVNLDAARQKLGTATVDIGARGARLIGIRSRLEADELRLKGQLNEVESVDVVDALISAKAQENSYQAALQVAAKILPPSLLDFLR